ncbi:DUF485 domain-containing protein [Streptomyces sp. enrichment culture]|uniref:DUF485 domain-containing protein n=1 Tax=Streptomyces sp. enrichment culture TaxID=1795815 RepID=UPI003F57BCC9
MHSTNGRPRAGGDGPRRTADRHEVRERPPADASGPVGYDDPWYDALAADWGESDEAVGAVPHARVGDRDGALAAADAYLVVQRSAAFQEVRSRYRGFVVPAVIGFLVWYLGYLVAATTAPGLMARPVVGAVNVAMLAGLAQFLTTFALTWAYARHARLRRDRAALELRWDTQELTRGARGGGL